MEPEVGTPLVRKRLKFNIKNPDVSKLLELSNLLGSLSRQKFVSKYGNLLKLLTVNVQVEAITALAQYYDPPLRCFTFCDFQLAPTLEEYELIFGKPLENKKPYCYHGHCPSTNVIANILKVDWKELDNNRKERHGVVGFSRQYLERYADALALAKNWDIFIDVLAFLIFGIVLFPNAEEVVDMEAADVFVAYKTRGEHPVPAMLADLYYNLNLCHERRRRGERILCCLPALFIWMTAHMFRRSSNRRCPFGDFWFLSLNDKDGQEWVDFISGLDETKIRWYHYWEDRRKVICQCKGFPNVPLMGTKGCINYNPVLALRQLNYQIRGPPTEEALTPFCRSYAASLHSGLVGEISRAWNNPIRKDICASVRGKITHRQWILDRVAQIGLPFAVSTPVLEESIPMPEGPFATEPLGEELEKMKERLAQADEKSRKLESELEEVRKSYESLKLECSNKDESLKAANKRARERNGVTDIDVSLRIQAQAENQRLKEALEKVKREAEEHLHRNLEALMVKHEQEVKVMKESHQKQVDQLEEYIKKLQEAERTCSNCQ